MQNIIVFAGPSGCGKSTACDYLAQNLGIERVIWTTTRSPRPNEVSEKIYVSHDEFEKQVQEKKFAYHFKFFNGDRYGIGNLSAAKSYCVELPPNEIIEFKKQIQSHNVIGLYVYAEPEKLISACKDRCWSQEEQNKRILNAKTDLDNFNLIKEHFDKVIVNDYTEEFFKQLNY